MQLVGNISPTFESLEPVEVSKFSYYFMQLVGSIYPTFESLEPVEGR